MSQETFHSAAKNDPQVSELLRDIAKQSATEEDSSPQTMTPDALTALVGLVTYALYRWARNFFDHQRDAQEIDLVKQQLDLIAGLVQEKVPRAKAEKIMVSMLKEIRSRGTNDPAFQVALKLASGGTNPKTEK
jgi:hypothetical protein